VTFADSVRALFGQQRERISTLEQRIAALEARPLGVRYAGVWDAETDYAPDMAVSSSGSIWIARSPSRGLRPGEGPEWQLAVKRGRDGRDAR
jgi:hypothetical protein